MITAAGGTLILLGSLFAILGTIAGTCTMGSADELEIGGLVAAVAYVIGTPLIVWKPPKGVGWLLLSPAIAAMAYEAQLAISFFIAYHVHALSACAWKEGIAEYERDGREEYLTALWIGVSAFGIIGLLCAAARARISVHLGAKVDNAASGRQPNQDGQSMGHGS
jgi:hypothetical protein